MHLRARVFSFALLAFPMLAAAQQADTPVAASQESTPQPLVGAVPAPVPPPSQGELIPHRLEQEKSFPAAPRFMGEALVGTAVGAGGGLLGYLLGSQFTKCNLTDDVCSVGEAFSTVGPTLVGVELFSSLAVYGVGSLLDGRGTLLSAMLGGTAGTGLGLLSTAMFGYGGILAIPPLAAIGALIAFEVSGTSREPERVQLSRAGTGLQMVPVLATIPQGGFLGGLAGRF